MTAHDMWYDRAELEQGWHGVAVIRPKPGAARERNRREATLLLGEGWTTEQVARWTGLSIQAVAWLRSAQLAADRPPCPLGVQELRQDVRGRLIAPGAVPLDGRDSGPHARHDGGQGGLVVEIDGGLPTGAEGGGGHHASEHTVMTTSGQRLR